MVIITKIDESFCANHSELASVSVKFPRFKCPADWTWFSLDVIADFTALVMIVKRITAHQIGFTITALHSGVCGNTTYQCHSATGVSRYHVVYGQIRIREIPGLLNY